MKKSIRLIWKCSKCNDVVISYSHMGHDMNYCECGKTAVGLGENYQRNRGAPEEISRKQSIDREWTSIINPE